MSDGYKIQLPKVPEGFQIQDWLIKAFEDFARENSLPLEAAQGFAERMTNAGAKEYTEAQAEIARRIEFNKDVLRSQFGDGFEADMQLAREEFERQGFTKEAFDIIEQFQHPVTVIERLVQNAKSAAAKSPSANDQQTGPPGGTMQDDPAKLALRLRNKINEFKADEKKVERLENQQHPLHAATNKEWLTLHSQLAAAQAAAAETAPGGRSAPASQSGRVADLRGEIKRLEADPQFMAAFKDPRHFQHAARTAQRSDLLQRLATAQQREAMGARPSRSVEVISGEIDELQRTPFPQDVRDQQWKAATARHSALLQELHSATQHENAAAAAAGGAGAGEADDS